MRALLVSPSISQRSGGLAYSVLGYGTALATQGIETTVLAATKDPKELEWFRAEAPSLRIERLSARTMLSEVIRRTRDPQQSGKSAVPSIIHVFGLLHPISTFAARVALLQHQPLVICPLGMLSKYTYQHRRTLAKAAYFRLLEYPNLRGSCVLHFQSQPELEEADWHRLNIADREYVVPPPFRSGFEPYADCRSDHVVVFLGRLDPKKNIELLLDAWSYIRKAVPDAKLVIAGVGEHRYVRRLRDRA